MSKILGCAPLASSQGIFCGTQTSMFSTSGAALQLGTVPASGGARTAAGGASAGVLGEVAGDDSDELETLRLPGKDPYVKRRLSEHPGPPSGRETDSDDEVELSATPLEDFAGDLQPELVRRLTSVGITRLFPVQRETLRRVLAGEGEGGGG
jgi:hypothetical protein